MSIQSAVHMARNRNVKMAAVESIPNVAFIHLYNRLTPDTVTLTATVSNRGTSVRLRDGGDTYHLRRPKDALRITHIGERPRQRVRDRYTCNGEFAPGPDDSVVDVGAFMGELSWQLADVDDVENITAIEPDPTNAFLCRMNTPASVRVEGVAAYDSDGNMSFNVAQDGTESGILSPDKGPSKEIDVPVRRLDSILGDTPDWLKVEAEGNEPEVLKGLGDMRPERIVVNVSPERDGREPVQCKPWLIERGYQVEQRGHELFASYNGDPL